MMHLTEDQIYHLVEAIGNHETLTAEEEQQMEHIRSCKECMESYCIMTVLAIHILQIKRAMSTQ